MKKIVLACLIGMALLGAQPTANGNAKFASFSNKRIVDVYLEGMTLLASSDANTGTIVKVEVFQGTELKKTRSCSGYSCSVSLSGLSAGNYVARVTTSLTTYEEGFTI